MRASISFGHRALSVCDLAQRGRFQSRRPIGDRLLLSAISYATTVLSYPSLAAAPVPSGWPGDPIASATTHLAVNIASTCRPLCRRRGNCTHRRLISRRIPAKSQRSTHSDGPRQQCRSIRLALRSPTPQPCGADGGRSQHALRALTSSDRPFGAVANPIPRRPCCHPPACPTHATVCWIRSPARVSGAGRIGQPELPSGA